MELNEFVEKFAEQFEDTDSAEITATTNYHKLDEWSSLLGMMIIAFVKTDMNKNVTSDDFQSCATVKELYEVIMSK